MRSRTWTTRSTSRMQAHCEQGQTVASWGQKAQQPQDDAYSGRTQKALAAVPQHGAPSPQVLLPLQKSLSRHCWELLGHSPGQVASSCRAALEVAGAAIQSSTRRQGHTAASLSRPRAPWTITQTGRWGRCLLGTALKAPPHGTTSGTGGSPSSAAPQMRFLGQAIFFPVPQCPRLQNGNETASAVTQS